MGYRETIRGRAVSVRGRHKQAVAAGTGNIGDVVLEDGAVAVAARGSRFVRDACVGGAVPRQYIASVEIGAKLPRFLPEAGRSVSRWSISSVTLTDGSSHTCRLLRHGLSAGGAASDC
jgi:hypothetical protein